MFVYQHQSIYRIVNSGVCLGASFIMWFIPSQPDHVIINHWIRTGLVSLLLFFANWVILYLSALVMFRIKRLNYHANASTKGAKLAQFSQMVDDKSYSQLVSNENLSRDRGTTQPGTISTTSMFSHGSVMQQSVTDVGVDGNIQSTTSLLRATSTNPSTSSIKVSGLNYAAIQDAPMGISSSSLPRKRTSSGTLKTGSTKAAFAKQYDFPILDDEDGDGQQERRKIMRKKSASSNNIHNIGVMNGSSGVLKSAERLIQSAETAAVQSKQDEMNITNNPLQLRKGSK